MDQKQREALYEEGKRHVDRVIQSVELALGGRANPALKQENDRLQAAIAIKEEEVRDLGRQLGEAKKAGASGETLTVAKAQFEVETRMLNDRIRELNVTIHQLQNQAREREEKSREAEEKHRVALASAQEAGKKEGTDTGVLYNANLVAQNKALLDQVATLQKLQADLKGYETKYNELAKIRENPSRLGRLYEVALLDLLRNSIFSQIMQTITDVSSDPEHTDVEMISTDHIVIWIDSKGKKRAGANYNELVNAKDMRRFKDVVSGQKADVAILFASCRINTVDNVVEEKQEGKTSVFYVPYDNIPGLFKAIINGWFYARMRRLKAANHEGPEVATVLTQIQDLYHSQARLLSQIFEVVQPWRASYYEKHDTSTDSLERGHTIYPGHVKKQHIQAARENRLNLGRGGTQRKRTEAGSGGGTKKKKISKGEEPKGPPDTPMKLEVSPKPEGLRPPTPLSIPSSVDMAGLNGGGGSAFDSLMVSASPFGAPAGTPQPPPLWSTTATVPSPTGKKDA